MKVPDISFIYTFSIIVFVLNIFYYNTRINNALYFCNIFSLFGFCIMIWYYPTFFYDKYNWLIQWNILPFNVLCVMLHILPLILFIDKNHIDSRNIIVTSIDSSFIMLGYLFIFHSILKDIYPFTLFQLFLISAAFVITINITYANCFMIK
jgi:hypothetical protein